MVFVLDTNILIHLLRGSEIAKKIQQEYFVGAKPTLIISIVTKAEIKALALKQSYGAKKLKQLESLLSEFLVIPIQAEQLLNCYAEIDAFSQGKHVEHKLPKGMSARNMGKNDMWIAATALAASATLLTTDQDFGHLSGFPQFQISIIKQ